MICCKCGHDNAEKSHKVDPWCMYQVKDGKVINDLFQPSMIPEGWYDSPKAAREAVTKIDGRTKEGRQQRAILDDNSSGSNQQVG